MWLDDDIDAIITTVHDEDCRLYLIKVVIQRKEETKIITRND